MGRIRLQIRVLPWEQPGPSSSSNAKTRQETLKWCEPCTEDTPMQEVCDRVSITWERMFKDSEGPLNMRHLKTAYGDLVDIEARVVGDLFDDRGADGNICNSILEVHRYPPGPDELEVLQRFSSLAPTSTARPRKRPLELPTQSYLSQNSRNMHREIPSIEEWDAETRPFGTANKRPRTHESRLNKTFDAHQPSRTYEEQGSGLYHSSQTSGTQESIHQVFDSQKSPGKKHSNPYGTPTSLPLIGQQEPIPANEIDLSTIPDSPLGREATSVTGAFGKSMQLDRESTKSESPELRTSVHEVPPTNSIHASSKQPSTRANSPEPSKTPFIFKSASQPVSISQIVDEYAKNHGLGVRQTGEKAGDVDQTPNRRPSTADQAHVESSGNNMRKSDPIFDPIESDDDSFDEKQRMQSAKRLRSSKTPTARFTSPRASSKAGADHRDGHFVMPSIPQPRTNGARVSLGEVINPRQRENIQKPETRTARQTPKSNSVLAHDDLADAAKTLSQATTALSQDSKSNADEATRTFNQQRQNRLSSQDQEPGEKRCSAQDADSVVREPNDDRLAQEAKRSAKEVEEQQEKKRSGEKKAREKRLAEEVTEKEIAAKETYAAERKANEDRLSADKNAKAEKARAEELAQAKMTNAKEEKFAEAKRIEETKLDAARLAEEKETSERLAREQQTRETALAEEANKMMLAAEGAKQIEAEKKEKEKARRKELAAKKQANEAKADEQAKEAQRKDLEKKAREEQLAREKAQKLADSESKDAKQRILQAGTAQETATAMKEHSQKILTGRDLQRSKNSSDLRSRASTTPSTSLNVAGLKRSMTPAIPGSSVTKSSPHQSSLGSSPLSNRSSGNMDAPLRSALRQTPSALRRSVSSVSFDVPPRSKLNEYIPSTPNQKSLKEINNELATQTSFPENLPKASSRTVSNAPSKTPMKSPVPKKATDTKITKTPAKNGKVQTKLNVTREVNKLKGRAGHPPIVSKQAPKQEIVISSGEESSSSEEPVWQTGNAVAGPSSRKPSFPITTSQGKKTAVAKFSGATIDPTLRNIKVEDDTKIAPATLLRSKFVSDKTSLQKSTSRSPALALSETVSLSSGTASTSASDPDSELESDSEEEVQAPSSKTPTSTKSSKPAPITMNGVSKATNVVVKQPDRYSQSKASSQSSNSSSSRSRNTSPVHSDGKHVDLAANKQLQLESRQSETGSRTKQASSTTNGTTHDEVINQGLDHAGRLPNGIRPAYYKYPGLSELQKLPRAVTPVAKSKPDASSQAHCGLPVGESASDTSSSNSEESSSNSDSGEDVDGIASQNSSNKKSGRYPGMRGVLKLANVVRSKFGPAQQ